VPLLVPARQIGVAGAVAYGCRWRAGLQAVKPAHLARFAPRAITGLHNAKRT